MVFEQNQKVLQLCQKRTKIQLDLNVMLFRLIVKYIELIGSDLGKSELYKWKAIQHFQKTWNIEASDFQGMFKEAFKFRENLMFQNSHGFLNKIASNFPEDTRSLFRDLLDDSVPLENRITNHQKKSDELLAKLREKLGTDKINHQQDERTISFILTLHNPEKYYLYKDNVYKALCNHLKVTPENKAGKKYFHFEHLAEPLLTEIRENEEIQTITKSFIPADFPFDSTKLIFQDIIYRTLVGSQKDDEDFKDEIYLITDDVREELIKRNHPLAKHIWYNNDAKDYRQVSVFPSPEIPYMHYEIMRRTNFISWEFHPEGDIEKKEFLQPFVNSFDSKKYKKVDWKHSIPSEVYVKGNYHKIVTKNPVKYPIPEAEYANAILQLTNQFEELYADTNNRLIEFLKDNGKTNELPTNSNNTMSSPLNQILYGPPGTGKTYHTAKEALMILGESVDNLSRSEIIERYSRFVKEGRIVFTTFHQSLCYEEFIEGLKPLKPESRKEAVTYDVVPGIFKSLCTDAMEAIQESMEAKRKFTNDSVSLNFSEKYKLFINVVKRGAITFKTKTGKEANLTEVTRHGNFRLTTRVASYIISEDRLGKLREVYSNIDQIKNVEEDIRKVIGGCNSSLFYAALQAFIEFEKELAIIGTELSEEFDLFGTKLSDAEINQLPRFVLIIDEINRGNVSSIFGELITLLEHDKRFGRENATVVELPYSGDQFIVPPNVYVVGTMNTADRSVEALDTALRRRFSFTEMLPDPDLIRTKGVNNGIVLVGSDLKIDLSNLLTVLNKRIEVLVDRDHTIGHSFFMKVDGIEKLHHTFKNNIIPQLQEYFYGDYSKMEMVIGSEFFEKTNSKDVVFATKNPEYDFEKVVYKIKNLSESEFISAIQKLITGVVKQ